MSELQIVTVLLALGAYLVCGVPVPWARALRRSPSCST